MTKFDWEKEPYASIRRHQQKRQTQQDYLNRKKARLLKKEKELQRPYRSGIEMGRQQERERIIDLALSSYDFFKEVSDAEFKLPDGNDVIEVNEVHMIFNRFRAWAHKQITGEK